MYPTFSPDINSTTAEHLKVAVLAGGIGSERSVSIQSGKCVANALRNAHANVIISDITPENLSILDDKTIDVFFLALHGKFGEDGRLQQILEQRKLPYTGSAPEASRIGFDKIESKQKFKNAGVNICDSVTFHPELKPENLKQLNTTENKYVVKPACQGSSVGINIVKGPEKAIETAAKTEKQYGPTLIEQYIPGREITVGILCDHPLPTIEIRPKVSFYDYNAKYQDEKTEFLFDTIRDKNLVKNIQKTALDCFNAIGCEQFARVDFILAPDDRFYALEVNTLPGFTTHSLLPMAAQKTGCSMSQLCMKIALAGIQRNQKNKNINQNNQ